MENDATILIRVPQKMKNKLQQLADDDKRKLSDYIRVQLETIIEQLKKKGK